LKIIRGLVLKNSLNSSKLTTLTLENVFILSK
jgi:hypothetical protein